MARGRIKVCPVSNGASLDSRRFSLGELEALGYVTLGRGKVISKEDIKSSPGGYPVYSSSAVGSGEIGRYGLFMFDDERITWSIDGGGRLFYRPAHKYSVTNVCGWLKVNTSEISTRYLHLLLTARWQRLVFDYTYKAHPSVIRDAYQNLSFPNVQEQTRVSSVFDKLEKVIAQRKSQLDTLSNLVKSRFVEMFGDLVKNDMGWAFSPLGKVCDVRDGTHASPQYHMVGYPLMTSKNFTNGYEDFSDVKLISKDDFDEINRRSRVDVGDIVMPMIGTIGSPVIITSNREFAIKNVSLIKFIDGSPNNVFVKAVLSSRYFQRIVDEKNRGNTQKFIALSDIRGFRIPLPPIALQREFAAFVAKVDKLAFAIRKSLEAAEKLYRQQLSEAFS